MKITVPYITFVLLTLLVIACDDNDSPSPSQTVADEGVNTDATSSLSTDTEAPSTQPEANLGAMTRGKKFDGELCATNTDCLSGLCVIVNDRTGPTPGYCTRDCMTDTDCVGEPEDVVVCLAASDDTSGYCDRTCQTNEDCYGEGLCLTDEAVGHCQDNHYLVNGLENVGVGNPPEFERSPIERTLPELICLTEFELGEYYEAIEGVVEAYQEKFWQVTVELPEDAISMMLSIENTYAFLESIESEEQSFSYYDVADSWILNTVNRENLVVYSYNDLGQPDSLFQPGWYTFTFESQQAPCYRLYMPKRLGSRLDINLYNLTDYEPNISDDDRTSPLEASIDYASSILNTAGLQIGEVRVMEVDPSNRERFGIIETEQDFYDMLASVSPDDLAPNEKKSLNVFIIDHFELGYSAVGLAPAIGGPPGSQGTSIGGVAVALAPSDPRIDFTSFGQTLAHEIGHYLGLEHTSKQYDSDSYGLDEPWFDEDRLNDTPTCDYDLELQSYDQHCSDSEHLMYGNGSNSHQISPKQGLIMRSSPLVY